jgi:hypothetical protein
VLAYHQSIMCVGCAYARVCVSCVECVECVECVCEGVCVSVVLGV